MGLRDLLQRLAGRGSRSGSPGGRRRSEVTVQLGHPPPSPVEARVRAVPAAPQAAPEPRRAPAQPTPAPAARRAPAPEEVAAADAETLYHVPAFKKSEVTGVLVVIDGELKGEVYKLHDGENKLGRSESCDAVMSSKWISREHAMVVHQDGVFAIVPLTENNRTFLNEREVDGAELSDGDVIRLGRTHMRFRSIEGP